MPIVSAALPPTPDTCKSQIVIAKFPMLEP
jgi:hypothetical protein